MGVVSNRWWLGCLLLVMIINVLTATADAKPIYSTGAVNKDGSYVTITQQLNGVVNQSIVPGSGLWGIIQNLFTWNASFFTDEGSIGTYLRPAMFILTACIVIPLGYALIQLAKPFA